MLQEDNGFRDIVATLKLQDLLFIKKLGEGQFGHVYLVKTKTSDNLYALKAVSKEQIVKQNLEKHTLVAHLLTVARERSSQKNKLQVHYENVQNLQR